MNIQDKKCSLKKHSEVDAVIYCQECKLYLCNKCQSHHLELFDNHNMIKRDLFVNDNFTVYCNEQKHKNYFLEYYCQSHNKLCCAACIAKIKGEGNGQHTDCKVCLIKDIKEEKRSHLKENIKILEELSLKFNESFNYIKNM